MALHKIRKNKTENIALTLSSGLRWEVRVSPEKPRASLDLTIYDSAGKVVAQDNRFDADAHCAFDAVGDAKYNVEVSATRGGGRFSIEIKLLTSITKEEPATVETTENTSKNNNATPPTTTEDSNQSNGSSSTSSQTDTEEKPKETVPGTIVIGSNGIKEILKRGLTEGEKKSMLQAHNDWRARYGVDPLQWCETLTEESQKWADELANLGFKLKHSPAPPRTSGENIAYGANSNLTSRECDLITQTVVDMWGNEVNDYDYETNTCAPGKVCGHYTQVVWKATQKVGGAMAKGIVENDDGSQWVKEVWVCNYDPPGNFIGQKPY